MRILKIFLDDKRNEPLGWFRVTTVENCIRILEEYAGHIDSISLDHDLGTSLDGHDVAKWIEEKAFNKEWLFVPMNITCHSANYQGSQEILHAIKNIERWRNDSNS